MAHRNNALAVRKCVLLRKYGEGLLTKEQVLEEVNQNPALCEYWKNPLDTLYNMDEGITPRKAIQQRTRAKLDATQGQGRKRRVNPMFDRS